MTSLHGILVLGEWGVAFVNTWDVSAVHIFPKTRSDHDAHTAEQRSLIPGKTSIKDARAKKKGRRQERKLVRPENFMLC